MTPAPETAALVRSLRLLAGLLRDTGSPGYAGDCESAASYLSQPEPQGTASDLTRTVAEVRAALATVAVPGREWSGSNLGCYQDPVGEDDIWFGRGPIPIPQAKEQGQADADLIAHAPPWLSALCDGVEAMQRDVAQANKDRAQAIKAANAMGTELREAQADFSRLEELYRDMCGRLRAEVDKRHLGLGGEQLDVLVIEALEKAEAERDEARAITRQDEQRLLDACTQAGEPSWGCDSADHLAEMVLELRAERDAAYARGQADGAREERLRIARVYDNAGEFKTASQIRRLSPDEGQRARRAPQAETEGR